MISPVSGVVQKAQNEFIFLIPDSVNCLTETVDLDSSCRFFHLMMEKQIHLGFKTPGVLLRCYKL